MNLPHTCNSSSFNSNSDGVDKSKSQSWPAVLIITTMVTITMNGLMHACTKSSFNSMVMGLNNYNHERKLGKTR